MSSPLKKKLSGIVLRTLPFKERDGILYLATEEKIISVFAKGIYSSKSKNRRLSNPYSMVELEVFENKDSCSLIHGILLDYAYWVLNDLESTAVCMILVETILPETMNLEIYRSFRQTLFSFEKGNREGILAACLCLYQVLRAKGIAPQLDACVNCGSRKKIRTISMEEGGFLCGNCISTEPAFSKKRLSFFYQLSHNHVDDSVDIDPLSQFEFLCYWYEQYQDISLKGFRFLQQVKNLGSDENHQDGDYKSPADIT